MREDCEGYQKDYDAGMREWLTLLLERGVVGEDVRGHRMIVRGRVVESLLVILSSKS